MNPYLAPDNYVCDGTFKVSPVIAPEYPEALLKICEDNEIGMVIPTIDMELKLLSCLKTEFNERDIKVIVGDEPFISILETKGILPLSLRVMGYVRQKR